MGKGGGKAELMGKMDGWLDFRFFYLFFFSK